MLKIHSLPFGGQSLQPNDDDLGLRASQTVLFAQNNHVSLLILHYAPVVAIVTYLFLDGRSDVQLPVLKYDIVPLKEITMCEVETHAIPEFGGALLESATPLLADSKW